MVGGLGPLCKRITEDLWRNICQVFPDEDMEVVDPIMLERSYHDAFSEARTKGFVGRKELLSDMTKFADEPSIGTLLLSGPPGCGKSALVATFASQYQAKHPNVYVLPHFIGAAPGSSDIRRSLQRVCMELGRRFGIEDPIPEDYKNLQKTFVKFLEQASFQARMVLILDGLDQLDKSNRAHSLDWLPAVVPAKLIVTSADGQCLKTVQQRTPKPREIVVPALAVNEGKEIVQKILAEYHKKLDDRPMNDQLRVLLKKTDASRPLYLVVACEELRVFGIYEQLTDKIKNLPPTLPKLFDDVLIRLEDDHGKALVSQALSVLACSRGGLQEDELLAVLKREQDDTSLPRAVWGRLYHALKIFLRPPGEGLEGSQGTIDFFHAQFKTAVEKRYLSPLKLHAVHCSLAAYFMGKADPKHNGSFRGTPRGISELPYHLTMAQMWPQLYNLLTSLIYVEKKCGAAMSSDLLADYVFALSPETRTKDWQGMDVVRQFYNFVANSIHILATHPHLTFQQVCFIVCEEILFF